MVSMNVAVCFIVERLRLTFRFSETAFVTLGKHREVTLTPFSRTFSSLRRTAAYTISLCGCQDRRRLAQGFKNVTTSLGDNERAELLDL